MKKKKKSVLRRMVSALLGFFCALVLGGLFYGAMVYQLGGEREVQPPGATPAPLENGQDAQALFPGRLLALDAQMTRETVEDVPCAQTVCRVVSRSYAFDGDEVTAVSAYPAAYLSLLAQEGYVPQLITGFSLAGLDAVCERRGEQSVLAARSGECVYLLKAKTDEPTLYALGAGALLE